ncbi:MAG: Dabb family protein [Pseudomonadota bacterium]
MSYRFIKLFSLKEPSEIVIDHFKDFLKSNEINKCTFQIEQGLYASTENRNQGYNYLLKVTSFEEDIENFKIELELEKEYKKLLKTIALYLNENHKTFSIYYEPSQQFTNLSIEKTQINHIVFLPFKSSCTDEEIDQSFLQLKKLFNDLPGISSFCYGKCEGSLEKSYVFEMGFSDKQARDSYLTNDQHVKVANYIIPLLEKGKESIIVFDYSPSKINKRPELKSSSFFSSVETTAEIPETSSKLAATI